VQRIFSELGNAVPHILYVNGCANILESMADTGADVLSIDWRLPIAEAMSRVGSRVAIQGNLDPCMLLGTSANLTQTAGEILKQAGPTGHIFNLGHGILPSTPVENARALIDFVKDYRHHK
jgi:uroporphyrinogen decarboxylase